MMQIVMAVEVEADDHCECEIGFLMMQGAGSRLIQGGSRTRYVPPRDEFGLLFSVLWNPPEDCEDHIGLKIDKQKNPIQRYEGSESHVRNSVQFKQASL